jgi:AcrR family transcriptional regulator
MAPKAKPRRTAQDWVTAAFHVLAAASISDVKVERLAKDLGVTKGSFYWHFADRDALLDAIRQTWVHMGTEQIIQLVQAEVGSSNPREAIRTLVELSLDAGHEFDGVEGAIREWSAHDPETARVAAAVDERRLAYVVDHFVAGGMSRSDAVDRAGLLYRILIGDYVYRRHGGQPVEVAAVQEMVDRFFE